MKGTAFLASLLLLRSAPAADAPTVSWALPPELQQKANDAVRRGRDSLLAAQKPDGSFGELNANGSFPQGLTALCMLALLKSGVDPDAPAVQKGFAFCRKRDDKKVYSTGTLLMALEARREKKPKDSEGLAWMEQLTQWLLEHREESTLVKGDKPAQVWSYPSPRPAHLWDQSIIQYALLGLKSARRCGIKVSKEAFWGPLRHLLEAQEKAPPGTVPAAPDPKDDRRGAPPGIPRGWGYRPGERPEPSGSLTCAGLAALLLARSELLEDADYQKSWATKADQSVSDGFSWLGRNFSVKENPKGLPLFLYYYLYGIERCGAMGRTECVGGHFWYREGAEELCRTQQKDGSWEHPLQTSFALLFLQRATPQVQVPAYEVGGDKPSPP